MGRACHDPADTLMTHEFVSTAKVYETFRSGKEILAFSTDAAPQFLQTNILSYHCINSALTRPLTLNPNPNHNSSPNLRVILTQE